MDEQIRCMVRQTIRSGDLNAIPSHDTRVGFVDCMRDLSLHERLERSNAIAPSTRPRVQSNPAPICLLRFMSVDCESGQGREGVGRSGESVPILKGGGSTGLALVV